MSLVALSVTDGKSALARREYWCGVGGIIVLWFRGKISQNSISQGQLRIQQQYHSRQIGLE